LKSKLVVLGSRVGHLLNLRRRDVRKADAAKDASRMRRMPSSTAGDLRAKTRLGKAVTSDPECRFQSRRKPLKEAVAPTVSPRADLDGSVWVWSETIQRQETPRRAVVYRTRWSERLA